MLSVRSDASDQYNSRFISLFMLMLLSLADYSFLFTISGWLGFEQLTNVSVMTQLKKLLDLW